MPPARCTSRFFHGGYLEGRLKDGQQLVLHGKVDADPYRPGRLEMVNPQIELIGATDGAAADSTEVGRIVPIYEAIGGISSRMLRRIIYGVLRISMATFPIRCRAEILERYRFPVAPRCAALRALSAAGRKRRTAQQFSQPRAYAPDLRGIFLLSTGPGAAPPARPQPRGASPCASAKRKSATR